MRKPLPAPAKVGTATAGVLRSAGLPAPDAWAIVIDTRDLIARRIPHDDDEILQWVYQVQAHARTRAARHRLVHTAPDGRFRCTDPH